MRSSSDFCLAILAIAVHRSEPNYGGSSDLAQLLHLPSALIDNPEKVAIRLITFILLNYVLNMIAVGVPAVYSTSVRQGRIAVDLIWFTMARQVIAYIGGVLAVGSSGFVAGVLQSEASGVSTTATVVAMNVILYGSSIGCLAYYFCRTRWRMIAGRSYLTAVVAGLVASADSLYLACSCPAI